MNNEQNNQESKSALMMLDEKLKTEGQVTDMLMKNRTININPPNWEILPRCHVFDADEKPQVDNIKAHLYREGLLGDNEIFEIIDRFTAIVREESNVIKMQDPVTVVGDIHGQFFDLIKLFEIGGNPETQRYIFLGDLVDRGCFGCEVVLLLFALKIKYPEDIIILRGNHECRSITTYFNFKKECLYKYNLAVYNGIMSAFDCLPLVCILNQRFFCVHGGLSPRINTITDINRINRFTEISKAGPMCDLLWADPIDESKDKPHDKHSSRNSSRYHNKLKKPNAANIPTSLFVPNELRGCSYSFSYEAACKFLSENNLLSIIRAHEVQNEGYKLFKKTPVGFPSVITIFSAPNYCDTYNNKAAVIKFQNNVMNIRQFNSVAHPYCLPNFINAFQWSFPFIAEKIADMIWNIWNVIETDESEEQSLNKSDYIRTKVSEIGRISTVFKTLKDETESITMLKGLYQGQMMNDFTIKNGIKESVDTFDKAKELDVCNERMPTQD